MMKNTLNPLILKIADGDKEAFEELYNEMSKPVYYYLLHFCSNYAIAEDIMQDTFITIWNKSSTFIPKGDGRAWILSIAKNKVLYLLKRENRICSIDDVGNVAREEGMISLFENKTLLDEMLRVLNNRELDIVILRHIVGLTLTEISKEKNIKKGTVFWLYNRAIKKLRIEAERIGLL